MGVQSYTNGITLLIWRRKAIQCRIIIVHYTTVLALKDNQCSLVDMLVILDLEKYLFWSIKHLELKWTDLEPDVLADS